MRTSFSFLVVEETDGDTLIQRRVTDDPGIAHQWGALSGATGKVTTYQVKACDLHVLMWLMTVDTRPADLRDPEISCPMPMFAAMHGVIIETVQ